MPRARRTRRSSDASARPGRAGGFLTDAAAARPLASLLFLAPVLGFYVVGLIWVRPDLAARADVVLRRGLELLGVTGTLAPTWLAVIVLVGWHVVRHDPWHVRPGLLAVMAAETVVLAVPLLAMERIVHAFRHAAPLQIAAAQPAAETWLEVVMTSIGAGLYEELLFRLLVVGGAVFLLSHALKDDSFGARLAVVLIAAGLFSGAHVVDDPRLFAWAPFLFRAAAGVYLGFIFLYRGFGVAAGVHILFDLVLKAAAALG
ncbi:MAG: CPBP family intramembrane metalloprotease [Planctomycetes bacterium]|nr:CPBP family intramembrane metalloprotease [Planctomycetota bacterium]